MDSKNGKTEDKTTDDEDAKQESTIEISNIMEEDERFKEDLHYEIVNPWSVSEFSGQAYFETVLAC